MKIKLNVKIPTWAVWIFLPLRLFLGITFLYAGVEKMTDAQFFNPAMPGYIGRQITNFAISSPLHSFLLNVAAPHAMIFGVLVACGETAIGLCTLLGLFARASALFGMLINLIFYFSATWAVHPYFYGSDIVFVFCWLTLLIAGPANQILPAVDTWIVIRLIRYATPKRRPRTADFCEFFFGVKVRPNLPPQTQPSQLLTRSQFLPGQPLLPSVGHQPQADLPEQPDMRSRRSFVLGTVSGGGVMLILVWLFGRLRPTAGGTGTATTSPVVQGTPVRGATGTPTTSPTPTNTLPKNVIAQISAVPVNSAQTFTLPANGDIGILIHLQSGQFVAYDSTCTHAGCPVDYDPTSQDLVCPCHGATYDPAKKAMVLVGPAQRPLTPVSITVDQNAGTISLVQ